MTSPPVHTSIKGWMSPSSLGGEGSRDNKLTPTLFVYADLVRIPIDPRTVPFRTDNMSDFNNYSIRMRLSKHIMSSWPALCRIDILWG